MSARPNILYIVTDQHRADWLGCAGHPVVKTPNIDKIAARGTRMTDFYVTTPVCMPNRGAIFTGRYPSANGSRHNGLPLPADANTFVDVLRAGGYRTASIGKSHLQPMATTPANRSDETRSVNPDIPEARKSDQADYGHESAERYAGTDYYEFPESYYGFEHVRMVTNHSDACGGHYLQWLRSQTDDWEAIRDRANALPHNFQCPQAIRTAIPEELYPTAFVKNEAKDWISKQAEDENPFFAFVSFPDPHHPWTPPGKYWDMYDPEDFEVNLPYEAHENPPPQLQEWKRFFDSGNYPSVQQQAFIASEQDIKEAMALTAGMITMIDNAIGEILDTLEASGQLDNTIIIFNSDHGDYMGAFLLLLKGPFAHHSVNRVPFIWADPELPGVGTADGLAASVDIAATILERVGLKPYYGMHSRSFLDQLSGGAAARDAVLIEHEENKIYPGFDRRPNMRHCVTKDYRLTIYEGLERAELYDRKADPEETRNIWNDPDARAAREQMMFTMSQALLSAIEKGPWPQYAA